MLVDIIVHLDPDIVTGWEVQSASWGFLAARAATYGKDSRYSMLSYFRISLFLGLDLGEQISRAPGRQVIPGSDQWGQRTTSTFKVVGRHVLSIPAEM